MNYKKINEVLSDLSAYNLSKKYPKVETKQSDNYHEEKNQGEFGVKTEVFKLDFDDLFLKVTTHTDSYGDRETVAKVEFVKPVVKQITVYEAITE